jgi:hypothetical protein
MLKLMNNAYFDELISVVQDVQDRDFQDIYKVNILDLNIVLDEKLASLENRSNGTTGILLGAIKNYLG